MLFCLDLDGASPTSVVVKQNFRVVKTKFRAVLVLKGTLGSRINFGREVHEK